MGSNTPNLGLYKPSVGETGWGTLVDGNFDTLDQPGVWTVVTDGGNSVISATSYGAFNPSIAMQGARGTKAAPTKTLLNDVVGRFGAKGAHDVGGVGTFPGAVKARIDFQAGEDYNDSTHVGNFISLWVTPNASGTPGNIVNFGASGYAIQGVPTADLSYMLGSSAGLVDTTISNVAMGWIARSMNRDQDEHSFSIQAKMATFSPTAQREKSALAVKAACQVNSGAQLADCIGVLTQGIISNTTTTGRAWGLVTEAVVNTTSDDGLIIGAEIGMINHGSDQTAVDTATSKYNIWLSSFTNLASTNKVTAGLAFANQTAGWTYGFYMRNIVTTFVDMSTPAGSSGTTVGIAMHNHASWKAALIAPNAVPIQAYDSGGTTPRNMVSLTSADELDLGVDANVAGIKIGNSSTSKLGFCGTTPVTRPAAYTVTNPTTDRGLNVTADTLAQGLQVLGTLIADLQALGLIS